MHQIQVDQNHYRFESYMSQMRWASIWHQVAEVKRFSPQTILEVGPGPGIFQSCCQNFNMKVETVDLDPMLNPTYISSATALPFKDKSYDVVCAFQMLEHLPYQEALLAFSEFARVAKTAVVISLPNAHPTWKINLSIPILPKIMRLIPHFNYKPLEHVFDGEHYWEIQKKGFEFGKVCSDFERHAKITNQYRIFNNPYHHMMIFSTDRK